MTKGGGLSDHCSRLQEDVNASAVASWGFKTHASRLSDAAYVSGRGITPRKKNKKTSVPHSHKITCEISVDPNSIYSVGLTPPCICTNSSWGMLCSPPPKKYSLPKTMIPVCHIPVEMHVVWVMYVLLCVSDTQHVAAKTAQFTDFKRDRERGLGFLISRQRLRLRRSTMLRGIRFQVLASPLSHAPAVHMYNNRIITT